MRDRERGTAWLLVAVCCLLAGRAPAQVVNGPHLDPQYGVERVATTPPTIGRCTQCHDIHDTDPTAGPAEYVLYRPSDNNLCYDPSSVSGCHNAVPLNYPLPLQDFMPDYTDYPGYPEANAGGEKIHGVLYRGRWPGSTVFESPDQVGGHYISPHRNDLDMPRQDAQGVGQCLNCHDPHGTTNPFDALKGDYRGVEGHADFGPPEAYQHCFQCHGQGGPTGMSPEGRLIEDLYDESINPGTAGHQIRRDPDIALSWPSYMQVGDKLPCSVCHNPHGSRGNDGVQPNAFLLNDAIPGWSGITDPLNVAEQGRRVCFGCHIPSDGVPGSREVLGIVMNTIPNRGPHRSSATRNCMDVHGKWYSSSTSHNIHNIGRGD